MGECDEPDNTTQQRARVCTKGPMLPGASGPPGDELIWRIHLGAHACFSNRTEVLVLKDFSAEVYREGDGRPIATASNEEDEKRKLFDVSSVHLPKALCIVVKRRQIEQYFVLKSRVWVFDLTQLLIP